MEAKTGAVAIIGTLTVIAFAATTNATAKVGSRNFMSRTRPRKVVPHEPQQALSGTVLCEPVSRDHRARGQRAQGYRQGRPALVPRGADRLDGHRRTVDPRRTGRI